MRYEQMTRGSFLERPNRFIARVALPEGEVVCHVKNTGRCKELLTPGAEVWLQRAASPARRTAFDLIAVRKGTRLINMDAAAPNRAFGEWAASGAFLPGLTLLRPETVHGDSRFDFYFEAGARRGFVEVKGVTLEENGAALFPDAPTLRGVKHLRGLARCIKEGYEAWAVFVVQMDGVTSFAPNRQTHPEFAQALAEAQSAGVRLLAMDCRVTPTEMTLQRPVEIRLE